MGRGWKRIALGADTAPVSYPTLVRHAVFDRSKEIEYLRQKRELRWYLEESNVTRGPAPRLVREAL
jgi:hypothetical protein